MVIILVYPAFCWPLVSLMFPFLSFQDSTANGFDLYEAKIVRPFLRKSRRFYDNSRIIAICLVSIAIRQNYSNFYEIRDATRPLFITSRIFATSYSVSYLVFLEVHGNSS